MVIKYNVSFIQIVDKGILNHLNQTFICWKCYSASRSARFAWGSAYGNVRKTHLLVQLSINNYSIFPHSSIFEQKSQIKFSVFLTIVNVCSFALKYVRPWHLSPCTAEASSFMLILYRFCTDPPFCLLYRNLRLRHLSFSWSSRYIQNQERFWVIWEAMRCLLQRRLQNKIRVKLGFRRKLMAGITVQKKI